MSRDRNRTGRLTSVCSGALVLGCLCLLVHCSDDSPCPSPILPSATAPTNGATEVPCAVTLKWDATELGGNELSYSLYLGENTPPGLVAGDITGTEYHCAYLRPNTTYYWRIVATGPDASETASNIWSFTTCEHPVFPLNVGNSWSHTRTMEIVYHPDSGGPVPSDAYESYVSMEVMGVDTLENSLPVFAVEVIESDEPYEYHAQPLVNNQPDGFYYYGNCSRSFGVVSPLPRITRRTRPVIFKGQWYASVDELVERVYRSAGLWYVSEDSCSIADQPVKNIPYPLAVGAEWTYRPKDDPWRMDKKVLGIDTLTVEAGTFGCFQLKMLYDINDDNQWDDYIEFYDYIDTKLRALVRRSVVIYGIVWTDYPGDSLGTFDAHDTWELTSMNLQ